MTEHIDLQKAIEVVQKAGYVVFNERAHRKLSVGSSMDARMVAAYSKDPSYLEYLKRDHATKMAHELLKSGHLKFEVLVPAEEDIKEFGYAMQTRMLSTFGFYSRKDKEWQR